ncbi:MAG: N-acetyl-gamma-glutamyl-phosphate reductase [Ruminococcaceae bacterium]|nr:N-acetyl-gamma-glutamyl-phosphate reductase [Oscillospiraceae bacterium]
MPMTKVFIDGSAGTTGLRIADRLAGRKDLEIITLSEALRKDPAARKDAIWNADIVFLCLPDDAAIEAVSLAQGSKARIIDTSTAHRTDPAWVYGFPELTGQMQKIAGAQYVANPGCHASGFVALVAPLVEAGILSADAALSCFSLTGYSGGGKKMIAQYEDPDRDPLLDAPRHYALGQSHKHLPEMAKVCGLSQAPIFCPIVADFYSGMEVTVPVFAKDLNIAFAELPDFYRNYYKTGLVSYAPSVDADGLASAAALSGKDTMQITVQGNDQRILLVSRFDNLGKGASGAAIENMNIMLGLDPAVGLEV